MRNIHRSVQRQLSQSFMNNVHTEDKDNESKDKNKVECAYFKVEIEFTIAGLQVTSWRPCWWSTTKAFLSAGK